MIKTKIIKKENGKTYAIIHDYLLAKYYPETGYEVRELELPSSIPERDWYIAEEGQTFKDMENK